MTATFPFRVCLLLLMMPGYDTRSTGIPITCQAGMYAAGQPASVTCNLPTDASVSERGITISRYPAGAPKNELGTDILSCKWVDVTQSRKCIVEEDGYTFDSIVNHRLTVRITSTSAEHTGLYMCFFVPPQGTDSHACALLVEEGSANSSRPPQPSQPSPSTGTGPPVWLTVVFGTAATVASVALCVVMYRFRSKRRSTHLGNDSEKMPMLLSRIGGNYEDSKNIPKAPNDEVEAIMKVFHLSEADVGKVKQISYEGRGTRIELATSNTRYPPRDPEKNDVLVVDLGSRVLKIQLVHLPSPEKDTLVAMYNLLPEIKTGTNVQLFSFIADKVSLFVNSNCLSERTLHVALVFPFPLEQDRDLARARVTKWTKEFRFDDRSKDVGEMLHQALLKKSTKCKFKITTIVNDAVATLISAVREDPQCKIAVILGNGFNACYVDDDQSMAESTTENQDSKNVIVNTELGDFGKDGSLDTVKNKFDKKLDEESQSKGDQIIEKMVSRMYVGELVRLVLEDLINQNLLFKSAKYDHAVFFERNSFNDNQVSLIESDEKDHHLCTHYVLEQLKVENYTEQDCTVVQYVCSVVSRRAAFLAAAALATLINKIAKPDVKIVVDGSQLISHPRFHHMLLEKTKEVVNPGLQFDLVQSKNGSIIGAALVAADSLAHGT